MSKLTEKFIQGQIGKQVKKQNLAQIAKAFYRNEHFPGDKFLNIFGDITISFISNMKPTEIFDIIELYHKFEFYHTNLLLNMGKQIILQINQLYSNQLGIIAKCFSGLGFYSERFFNEIQSQAYQLDFSLIDLSILIHSFGVIHHPLNSDFQLKVVQYLTNFDINSLQQELSTQEIIQLLWGLSILGITKNENVLQEKFAKCLSQTEMFRFKKHELSALYQIIQLQKLDRNNQFVGNLSPALIENARLTNLAIIQVPKQLTEFAVEVQKMVVFLGFSNSYQTEYLLEDIGIVLDIFIQIGRTKVAIMLNGPDDYCRNDPTQMLGLTHARNALIRGAGWELVQVPKYEWIMIMNSHDKRLYIQRKLKKYITQEIMEGKPSNMEQYLK
eukprot:TRINITY_DN14170_c0_g1_i2.p1 TRINITY_DN14170_c0_g1~~TRINITY_DN14170_c0_g1_i2.p1  ORF type:complete len:386 (+),score=32.75 TRINITY_DN14170_c0_g1_i2:29-1186(+)